MFDTTLLRDIRQTLDDFRRSVDRFFAGLCRSPSATNADRVFAPAVESGYSNDELMLRVILPAVAERDVNVTVQNRPVRDRGRV